MALNKLGKNVNLPLIISMIIIYSGVICLVGAEEAPTYLIFQEDFEDPKVDLFEISLLASFSW